MIDSSVTKFRSHDKILAPRCGSDFGYARSMVKITWLEKIPIGTASLSILTRCCYSLQYAADHGLCMRTACTGTYILGVMGSSPLKIS